MKVKSLLLARNPLKCFQAVQSLLLFMAVDFLNVQIQALYGLIINIQYEPVQCVYVYGLVGCTRPTRQAAFCLLGQLSGPHAAYYALLSCHMAISKLSKEIQVSEQIQAPTSTILHEDLGWTQESAIVGVSVPKLLRLLAFFVSTLIQKANMVATEIWHGKDVMLVLTDVPMPASVKTIPLQPQI